MKLRDLATNTIICRKCGAKYKTSIDWLRTFVCPKCKKLKPKEEKG